MNSAPAKFPFDDWHLENFVLPAVGTWPTVHHRFESRDVWAIRAALATGRPLLLRGKPGMGKSQMARAAAVKLEVPFLSVVVDERTERDDLLLGYDAVARLAQAQVVGALARREEDWEEGLKELRFVRPGPFWWAMNWQGAKDQADAYSQDGRTCEVPADPYGWSQKAERTYGPVILVDEIDKADPSVPNGLLETLANDGFQVQQPSVSVRRQPGVPPPLVIITTNEERELPPAFVRRCLVHKMEFPKAEGEAKAFLLGRARVHFQDSEISEERCGDVVDHLLKSREDAAKKGGHVPGPAEFLDVIRALVQLASGKDGEQKKAFQEIRKLAFEKHLTEDS